jgi:hypothetical protein
MFPTITLPPPPVLDASPMPVIPSSVSISMKTQVREPAPSMAYR